jgi:hypothetical protein
MTSMLFDVYTLKPMQRRYLTITMDRVSRSFALVVPWLEDPLQDYMATAYLLCRALDNIEDCGQPLAWQRHPPGWPNGKPHRGPDCRRTNGR